MNLQVIPLTTAPRQSFTAALKVDGKALSLNLKITYNEMAGYWIMAILDASNKLLVDSIPMITGGIPAANIIQQQKYLRIGSAYIVNVSNTNSSSADLSSGYGIGGYGVGGYGGGVGLGGIDYPDKTNLGSDFNLWWGDSPPD